MTREEREKIKLRTGTAMQEYTDQLEAFTKPLSQIDLITVSLAVSANDVSTNPTEYYAGAVGQNKYVATFFTEEDALKAINTEDFAKAKTLTTFKYPKAGAKIAIDRS